MPQKLIRTLHHETRVLDAKEDPPSVNPWRPDSRCEFGKASAPLVSAWVGPRVRIRANLPTKPSIKTQTWTIRRAAALAGLVIDIEQAEQMTVRGGNGRVRSPQLFVVTQSTWVRVTDWLTRWFPCSATATLIGKWSNPVRNSRNGKGDRRRIPPAFRAGLRQLINLGGRRKAIHHTWTLLKLRHERGRQVLGLQVNDPFPSLRSAYRIIAEEAA